MPYKSKELRRAHYAANIEKYREQARKKIATNIEYRDKNNERAKKWRKKQLEDRPEEFRKYNKDRAMKLYYKNPELGKKQQKRFKDKYHNDPVFRQEIITHSSLGRYGGMTLEDYNDKLAGQNGRCAICGITAKDCGKKLHIDHDHACCNSSSSTRSCGKCVRGLLCFKCNLTLAKVEFVLTMGTIDPTEGTWLSKATQYLTQYKV
jgi:Recombination endonuclease VII